MKTHVFISVVMALYNEKEYYARQSIESILSQSYSNFEFIIIIDNPLNENLIKIVNLYRNGDRRIKLIINNENIGLGLSLNKGISLSRGDYIARMDGDDIALSTRFEKQVDFLIDNEDISLVGSNAIIIDEFGRNCGKYVKPLNYKFIELFLRFCKTSCVIHPTWMFRRTLLCKVKGYRNFRYAQDFDFLLRVIYNKLKIANLREDLLYYRIDSSSISQKNAYRQYVNTQKAYLDYMNVNNKKINVFPSEIILEYNIKDEFRFQSVIDDLTRFKFFLYKRNFFKCLIIILKILKIDKRPILIRIRAKCFLIFVGLIDRNNLKK